MKIGVASDGREMHYSAGVVLECKGKYLLLDRINPPPGFAGPAGHIDEGEEPRVAALRELYEETGVRLTDLKPLYEEELLWNYCRSAGAHYWYLFSASVDSEDFKIEKDESKTGGWYTSVEMKELNLEQVWRYWFEKLKIL